MLMRRCKRAAIRFLHPHLFRHGFAMAYLNHGVDLKAVGDLMGHSSYKTTEKHYAKWMDDPLRKLHRLTAEAIVRGEN
jgi:integrase